MKSHNTLALSAVAAGLATMPLNHAVNEAVESYAISTNPNSVVFEEIPNTRWLETSNSGAMPLGDTATLTVSMYENVEESSKLHLQEATLAAGAASFLTGIGLVTLKASRRKYGEEQANRFGGFIA